MNKMERDFEAAGPAEIEYLDGEFRIVRPGGYIVCAASGIHVPLDALRYWNVDLQEGYATPELALKRFQETGGTPK